MAEPEESRWRLRERAEILASARAPDSPFTRAQTRLSFLLIAYENSHVRRPASSIEGVIEAIEIMPLHRVQRADLAVRQGTADSLAVAIAVRR